MFLQSPLHTGAENLCIIKVAECAQFGLFGPRTMGHQSLGTPPLIVWTRLRRGRKLQLALKWRASEQRTKAGTTNLLFVHEMWNSSSNRFHGSALTWPHWIRKVGESDQKPRRRGLIYLVAIAIPGVWPHTIPRLSPPMFGSTHACGSSDPVRPGVPVGNHIPAQTGSHQSVEPTSFLTTSPVSLKRSISVSTGLLVWNSSAERSLTRSAWAIVSHDTWISFRRCEITKHRWWTTWTLRKQFHTI